jgi:phosphoribosylformylglycinamidine cyclo-ligase
MPGMYKKDDFDLAGFCVGIAEKSELDREKFVSSGDILVALPSSGIHSNGYSLVRHLFFDKLNMKFDDKIGDKTLIDTLLEPTRIYTKEFVKLKSHINSLAHITGGGLIENIPRALPKGLYPKIDASLIEKYDIYEYIKEYVDDSEMQRTFNMGVGMVLVISPKNIDFILDNSDGYVIGEVYSR